VTDDRILGHLARRFAISEENIATEALSWLLRAPAARAAVAGLARAADCTVPSDLTFVGQVGAEGTGRPDIVGSDAGGVERLIVEAKFGAGLTEQQPGGYLRRLPADADSILLVVAPSARLPTLWVELLRAVPELAGFAPAPSAVGPAGLLHARIGTRTTLALVSWRGLVTRVLDGLRAAEEFTLAQDAEQLLALTEVMDSAAYVPVKPGDLDQRTGHLVHQLERIIDRTYRDIANDPTSPAEAYRNRSSHGRIFYGWYLRSRRTRVAVWFGFLPRTWARFGISPLWVQTTSDWSRHRLQQALGGLHEPGQAGLFEDQGFLSPLTVPAYASEADVTASLRGQLEDFLARLDAVVPPDESPVPDEPDDNEESI
jgi:hypothetical protein